MDKNRFVKRHRVVILFIQYYYRAWERENNSFLSVLKLTFDISSGTFKFSWRFFEVIWRNTISYSHSDDMIWTIRLNNSYKFALSVCLSYDCHWIESCKKFWRGCYMIHYAHIKTYPSTNNFQLYKMKNLLEKFSF